MSQIIRRKGRRIDAGFAALPNLTARNNDLTLRARGLLLLFMSHEPGVWSMTVESVARETREGRDVIRSVFRELEAAGYIRRIRENDAKGRITHYCDVYPHGDAPSPVEYVPDEDEDSPEAGYQSTDNQPLVGQPPFRTTSIEEPSTSPSVVEPPTQVSSSSHLSSDEPANSPTVPSSGQGKPLPVVLRRMLREAGVTEPAMPLWETAWLAAQQAEWPDWAEVEATRFYADHLPIYLSKTTESGRKPSPGTWLDWFHRDRVRQQEFLRARLEQENRFAEDPAEREARQNRHLPPDRSGDLDFLDNTPEGQALVAAAQRRTREAKQAQTGVQG